MALLIDLTGGLSPSLIRYENHQPSSKQNQQMPGPASDTQKLPVAQVVRPGPPWGREGTGAEWGGRQCRPAVAMADMSHNSRPGMALQSFPSWPGLKVLNRSVTGCGPPWGGT